MSRESIFPGFLVESYDELQPITTEQVKARLRILDTSLDDQIPDLIKAARQYVERYTKCILFSKRSIGYYINEWPADRIILLPFHPLAVDDVYQIQISYAVEGEVTRGYIQSEDISYDEYSCPCKIYISENATLPTLPTGINKILVYAKFGAATKETQIAPLAQCMYMLIAAWLENPNDQDIADLNYIHKILDQYTAR